MEKKIFYSLPFLPGKEAKDINYKKDNVENSIRQHIRLILMTLPNQLRFEPKYGCELNAYHFKLPEKSKGDKKLEEEIKDKVQKNLKFLLARYEPRLKLSRAIVNVNVPLTDKDNKFLQGGRISLEISIAGRILGRKNFQHTETIPVL